MKRKFYRMSFEWNETYDSTKNWIDSCKYFGLIVYDIAPEGVTYSDYIISNKPIKKYIGKEI